MLHYISYRIISYHIISYHIILCYIIYGAFAGRAAGAGPARPRRGLGRATLLQEGAVAAAASGYMVKMILVTYISFNNDIIKSCHRFQRK